MKCPLLQQFDLRIYLELLSFISAACSMSELSQPLYEQVILKISSHRFHIFLLIIGSLFFFNLFKNTVIGLIFLAGTR